MLSHTNCDSIILDSCGPIEGLALIGKIHQPKQNSFVRILLKDRDGREYLVLETCKLYNDVDNMTLSNYCEETKYLPDVYPYMLRVYTNEATVELSHVTILHGKESNTRQTGELVKRKDLSKENKLRQAQFIADNINENNKKHHRIWRADVTDISLLSWEEKKKILGIDGENQPTGFEYYSSGIFEIGEINNESIASPRINSPYIETFDWRNRHGINWMTSVKNQSPGNGCWAFSTVGVTEALVNLYYNKKIDYDLSEQEVISCSSCGTNSYGGNSACALSWISAHGISEEASFPFSNTDEPCSNQGSFTELIAMSGTAEVYNHTINNNDSVKKALIKYGPSTSGFKYNHNGYHGHAMMLVGYSTLHEGDTIRYFDNYYQSPTNFDVIQSGDNRIGKTYWIFKNSYGPNRYFEHKGYAYVLFNDQSCFLTPNYAKVPITSLIYSDTDIAITDNDGDGLYFWGIGPKPAHCPSWVPDTPDGDDSNINYGLLDEYGHLEALTPNGITIDSAVIYNSNTLSCRIGIVKNGTFTIANTTSMTNDAIIRVCENGTLIIDGGTLQNAKLELIPGCHLIIRNNGTINMAAGKIFDAPKGAIIDIGNGNIN